MARVVDCVTSPGEALALLAPHHAFSVIVTRPFALDATPDAWLDQLGARTHAAIGLCVAADRCAAYQAQGYAAVLELPCDLSAVADAAAAVSTTPR